MLDPFSGSGTTGIVAMNTGRNYIGIDINPEYNEIAKRRLENECEDQDQYTLEQLTNCEEGNGMDKRTISENFIGQTILGGE